MHVDSIGIEPQTGTVRLNSRLSYADVQRLDYVVEAKDGNNASTTATLTVNVIDRDALGPRFSADQYTAFVQELTTNLVPSITVFVSSPTYPVTVTGMPLYK